MNRENDRRSVSKALLDVPPSPDIAALETAAESLTRLGDVRNAIALWAIALRLRQEANGPDLLDEESRAKWEKSGGICDGI